MLRSFHSGSAPDVTDFLLAREEFWTSLTDRVFRKGILLPLSKSGDLQLLENSQGELRGLIYHEPAGFTFPAIQPPLGTEETAGLREALKSYKKITTLMGNSQVIDICVDALNIPPAYRVDYLLMNRHLRAGGFSTENPIPREIYEHLKPGQIREIYPLQKAYEIEEVLLEPDRFNPLICMGHLRDALKKQLIYGTRINGRLIAKAGTNALGVNWVQLGGIFTAPGYRGRGIARRLLSQLLSSIDGRGLGATLFVKPQNIPAVSLYKRVGFTEAGPFSIAYYLR